MPVNARSCLVAFASLIQISLVGILSAQVPAEKPAVPDILWHFDIKSPSYGSASSADIDGDGKPEIVFGTYYNDGHLYAVNSEDGSLLWKFKSNGGPFDASVAIADVDGDKQLEVLSADSADGTLFCLDGSGKLEWKTKLPSGTDSPPAIGDLDGDGALEIVVGTMIAFREGDKTHGRVVVLDARTQQVRWSTKIRGHVQSEPALVDLNDDRVLDVIVTNWHGDDTVYALNGKDGSELWKHEVADSVYHGVSVFQHKQKKWIVATSIAGDVSLLDASGNLIWKRDVKQYCFAPTTVADVDADGSPEIVVCASSVFVFDFDGKQRWKSPELGSIARGVAVADVDGDSDLDLVFGSRRTLHAIDGSTGKSLWTKDLEIKGHVYESINHAPLISDVDGDGSLEIFVVGGNGTSDETRPDNYGRAYLLRAGRGKGNWTTFRGNLHRTGTSASP